MNVINLSNYEQLDIKNGKIDDDHGAPHEGMSKMFYRTGLIDYLVIFLLT